MSAVAYTMRARDWAAALTDHARRDSGTTKTIARDVVARLTGISPGTLENLEKDRLKSVPAHVYDALRAGLISALEKDLGKLEHELFILKQTDGGPHSRATAAVVADIEKVREALGLSPADGGGG